MPESDFLRSYYDEFYRRSDFIHYPEATDIAFFRAIFSYFSFPAQPLILDAGCGTGVRTVRMSAAGAVPIGTDLSIEGLRLCRTHFDEPLVQADVFRLPFRDNTFDGVIALGCSVINDNAAGLESLARESLRATKRGGWVIATSISDFSGDTAGGWKQEPRSYFRRASANVDCAKRLLRYTAPRLASITGGLLFNPAVSFIVGAVPRLKRTIVMAWQK